MDIYIGIKIRLETLHAIEEKREQSVKREREREREFN